jgi:hypothetical protein
MRREPPFATAGQFFRQTGLHAHFARLAENVQIRRAFERSGFRLNKIVREQIRFEMTTAWASCPVDLNNRPMNAIRRTLLLGFRRENLPLRAKFLMTRVAGSKIVAAATLIDSPSK